MKISEKPNENRPFLGINMNFFYWKCWGVFFVILIQNAIEDLKIATKRDPEAKTLAKETQSLHESYPLGRDYENFSLIF